MTDVAAIADPGGAAERNEAGGGGELARWLIWLLWAASGAIASASIGSALAARVAAWGFGALIAVRWMCDRAWGGWRRLRSRPPKTPDAVSRRGLRHPLCAPLAIVAMCVLVQTRALLALQVKLNEEALSEIAAHAQTTIWMAGSDAAAQQLGCFVIARVGVGDDARRAGDIWFDTHDCGGLDSLSLVLASDHADLAKDGRWGMEYRHVFGRWWTLCIPF